MHTLVDPRRPKLLLVDIDREGLPTTVAYRIHQRDIETIRVLSKAVCARLVRRKRKEWSTAAASAVQQTRNCFTHHTSCTGTYDKDTLLLLFGSHLSLESTMRETSRLKAIAWVRSRRSHEIIAGEGP